MEYKHQKDETTSKLELFEEFHSQERQVQMSTPNGRLS